jgi:CRP/FNR family transcriptional regulator, anaerobic regulatory protein
LGGLLFKRDNCLILKVIAPNGMEYSGIIQNITKHITLEKEEVNYFTSLLTKREFRRKEFVLKEAHPCTTINYVQEGILRAFHCDRDNNESIIMFAIQDWWITDMYSFTTGQPTILNIDALENSSVFQLEKKDLETLFIKIPKFEKFFRIIMQNAYVREQLRVIQNLSMSAEERHNNFLKKYPQFASRVPLKQIASYLGITPEFLSVLRKKSSQRIIS